MKLADLRAGRRNKMWFVYLLECCDGTYYCGITTDLDRRVSEHNRGKGAKYTRGRSPVKLLVAIKFPSQGKALQVEAAVKKQKKAKKIDFLKSKGFIVE